MAVAYIKFDRFKSLLLVYFNEWFNQVSKDTFVYFLEEFDFIMKLREATHSVAPYMPTFDIATLFDETWYIDSIDEKHRRFLQEKTTAASHNCINGFVEA